MVVETESRVHATKAIDKGPAYYDYNEYKIPYGNIENYKITEYIGKGKYSQVFKGKDQNSKLCVIKVLKPVKEKKINREAMILKTLKDAHNIVQLVDIVKDPLSNVRSFVFAFEEHADTRSLFEVFTLEDVKYYSRKILETLEHCHSLGIFHRDIKPHNIIINHNRKIVKIIDWGLAEFYIPKFGYSVGVASMHFKAPELLVNYKTYDYAIDIWAFGCVFAEMIFGIMPVFEGDSNPNQLEKILEALGTEKFLLWTKKYDIPTPKDISGKIKSMSKEGTWKKIGERTLPLFSSEEEKKKALDLLLGMFEFDHQKRLTAKECLNMPFFL